MQGGRIIPWSCSAFWRWRTEAGSRCCDGPPRLVYGRRRQRPVQTWPRSSCAPPRSPRRGWGLEKTGDTRLARRGHGDAHAQGAGVLLPCPTQTVSAGFSRVTETGGGATCQTLAARPTTGNCFSLCASHPDSRQKPKNGAERRTRASAASLCRMPHEKNGECPGRPCLFPADMRELFHRLFQH